MNITILNITKETKTSSTGKPYTVLDIAFKNNTFQGKVEGKKLMPFGANAGAFKALENAQGGTYEITVVKNEKGYNDWTAATPSEAGPALAAGQQQMNTYVPKAAAPSTARPNGTFETPEERAKKQVSITRLATLNTAVAALTPGAKVALKKEDVLELAREFESYVFGIQDAKTDTSFTDMDSDIPE
jgi:hypothetical protein